MTAKPASSRKGKTAGGKKRGAGAPDTGRRSAVVIFTDDPAVAEAHYAKEIEGWSEMPMDVRQDIIAKTVTLHAMRKPPALGEVTREGDVISISPAHGEPPTKLALDLSDAFGTFSLDLAQARLNELIRWYMHGDARGSSSDVNAGLAFVHGCQPKTPVEATLATQMVMTNHAALRALSMAERNLHYPEHAQTLGNLAAKLLNTFTRQAEALAKLQRRGEQVIRHVHIDNRFGGQAVVTEQVVTGGVNGKGLDQPYGPGATMPGPDALGYGVPIASHEGQEALSSARRSFSGRS
jgi:hypothetical protein